ncbi:TetR/AcrR family transcriptional regulator [Streptomyces cinnabarinus]|uniref:TetR/AcrR family transcriptional regulator n=1 Tax=Streptomyces cinnabarinus TaxID=67287 RepID=A0ABY7KST7_9ACTN|nr:TetR/AcrR family transcriptional regulator [Streptomyces cinnabarinus]WAZ26660.1 TetR/AcrR family transcriptional regulator [Streptomyces cinnabarinus]
MTGSQRQRLLYAMTVVVAEKGYLATTVADVTSRAGVSRKTFYALFADKEECFIAAAEASRELTIKCLKASFAQSSEQSLAPVATLRASIRAYLRLVAEEPEFAKAFFLETASAGGRAREHQDACRSWFAESMRVWRTRLPEYRRVPHANYLAAADATHEALCRCLRQGSIDEVPSLEDAVLHICFALLGVADPMEDEPEHA